MPMGKWCAIRSPWHRMPEHITVPAFTIVRHPGDWIRSVWHDQSPDRVGHKTWIQKIWRDDLNDFALKLCSAFPGYVGALYKSYVGTYGLIAYRLEDGLDNALMEFAELDTRVPKVNVGECLAEFSPKAMATIHRSESKCLRRYAY